MAEFYLRQISIFPALLSRKAKVVATCVMAFLAASAGATQTYDLSVLGTANIWGAGQTGPAATPGVGGGTPAPFIAVTGGGTITVSYISSLVDINGGFGFNGPDGYQILPTITIPYNGLSAISYTNDAALWGTFLNDEPPSGSPPPSLSFVGNTSFASLSPQLKQVFFIGDGLTETGAGTRQLFLAPIGATRLYIGLADSPGGFAIDAPPGHYGDNIGSWNVRVTAVPEPDIHALLVAGMLAMGIYIPRRSR